MIETPAARHDRVVRSLARTLLIEGETEAETFVMLESLVLGVMLLHRRDPREAGEFLDTMSMRVIERMAA